LAPRGDRRNWAADGLLRGKSERGLEEKRRQSWGEYYGPTEDENISRWGNLSSSEMTSRGTGGRYKRGYSEGKKL